MSLKSRIEAVLFLTDKPLRSQVVARIVNEDVQLVRQVILELIHEYETRQGGLEISNDDGYIIQVKDEYTSIIDEFVPMELPMALLRTLSAIAIKQPIPQSEIIRVRGAGAYDHIKELLERELISKKEEGRSPLLSTTKKFQEYFRLSQDGKTLRNALRKQAQMEDEPPRNEQLTLPMDGESPLNIPPEEPLENMSPNPEDDVEQNMTDMADNSLADQTPTAQAFETVVNASEISV